MVLFILIPAIIFFGWSLGEFTARCIAALSLCSQCLYYGLLRTSGGQVRCRRCGSGRIVRLTHRRARASTPRPAVG